MVNLNLYATVIGWWDDRFPVYGPDVYAKSKLDAWFALSFTETGECVEEVWKCVGKIAAPEMEIFEKDKTWFFGSCLN